MEPQAAYQWVMGSCPVSGRYWSLTSWHVPFLARFSQPQGWKKRPHIRKCAPLINLLFECILLDVLFHFSPILPGGLSSLSAFLYFYSVVGQPGAWQPPTRESGSPFHSSSTSLTPRRYVCGKALSHILCHIHVHICQKPCSLHTIN